MAKPTVFAKTRYYPDCLRDNETKNPVYIDETFHFQMVIVLNIGNLQKNLLKAFSDNLSKAMLPYLKLFDTPPLNADTPTIWLGDYETAKEKWPFIQ